MEDATKEHIVSVAVEVLSPRMIYFDTEYLLFGQKNIISEIVSWNSTIRTCWRSVCETTDRILCLVKSPVDQIGIVVGILQ